MSISENDIVALLVEKPEVGLHRGDVGSVVEVFDATSSHPSGFIVEFVDEQGNVQGHIDVTDVNEIVKLRYRPVLEAA